MAEPEDLLGKADALMARHRPPGTPAEPLAGIPVLNEEVPHPRQNDGLPVLTEFVPPLPPDDEQIEALTQSLRASLLAALQPEIDALIEARLKDDLSPLIERLFLELRGELQVLAREILGDTIRAAVEQELKRRKSGS